MSLMSSNSMQALVSTTSHQYYSSLLAYYLPSGGLHRALGYASVSARVVAAYDWDPAARQVYDHNYPNGISKRVRTQFIFPTQTDHLAVGHI